MPTILQNCTWKWSDSSPQLSPASKSFYTEYIFHRWGCTWIFKNNQLVHWTYTGPQEIHPRQAAHNTSAKHNSKSHAMQWLSFASTYNCGFVCQPCSVNCDKRTLLKMAGLDVCLFHMDMRLTCFYLCLFIHLCLGNIVKQRTEGRGETTKKAYSTKCNTICPWEALNHEFVNFSQSISTSTYISPLTVNIILSNYKLIIRALW